MMSHAVVFDFGGVLFRWRPAVLLARCLPQRVVDEASAAHWVAQVFQAYGGDWGAFDRGQIGVPEVVARISTRTGLTTDEVQAVVDGVPDELAPVPETVALLQRLQVQGVPLYYLSNMPAPYAEHLQRSHDFLGAFIDGVFSSRVGLIKPDPAIFALAVQRFGRAPGELVFLDDHPANITAASEAGWQAIHFVDAAQASQALGARSGNQDIHSKRPSRGP